MTGLLANQLVEIPEEGLILRILWVDPLGRGYQVIDVQSDTAFPIFRDSGELAARIEYQPALTATHEGDSQEGLNVSHSGKQPEVCRGSADPPSPRL